MIPLMLVWLRAAGLVGQAVTLGGAALSRASAMSGACERGTLDCIGLAVVTALVWFTWGRCCDGLGGPGG